jgi:molybdate transport system substrate-binding protein
MNPMKTRLLPLLALGIAAICIPARAADPFPPPTLSIAAAANLTYALGGLNAEFKKVAPDVAITVATGASGSLVAQIENGAPYDIFLGADLDFPRALIKAGQADASTMTTFAVGRLVLWTTKEGIDVSDMAAAVRSPMVHKLAMANADTAPYGRAARQALMKHGAWNDAKPKIVVGENISQTGQFVETGNADAGFVAMSLVVSPKLAGRGRWTEVPATLYDSLEQAAVVTSHGASNPAAAQYLTFLRSPAARRVLRQFGYGMPVDR